MHGQHKPSKTQIFIVIKFVGLYKKSHCYLYYFNFYLLAARDPWEQNRLEKYFKWTQIYVFPLQNRVSVKDKKLYSFLF